MIFDDDYPPVCPFDDHEWALIQFSFATFVECVVCGARKG